LSCKKDIVETGSQIIDIDLDNLNYESLPELEIRSIIPLETNEASLIGRINRVEFFDGKFYILDTHERSALFAFTEEGIFLGKTKNGRGPGEMLTPYAVYMDKDSNWLYVWDQSLEIMSKFSLDLKFIDQEAFKHQLYDFAVLEDGRKLTSSHFYRDFMYKIYGADNETVEHHFIPDIPYPYSLSLFRSISVNERILAIAPFQYDIFELKGNELLPRYHVDFGQYKLRKADVENVKPSDKWKLIEQGIRVSSLNDISEGDSFLSFRVYFKSEALDFAYSFKDQKPYLINEYVGKNMLPACTVRGITEDDLFYAVVEPEDLDNFQKETGKILVDGEIDPESNPYIITFKLGELVKN
jgi:hypothetical protein